MSLFRFVFLLIFSLPVLAQDWPNKPVKFVSPYPPGGSVDPLAMWFRGSRRVGASRWSRS